MLGFLVKVRIFLSPDFKETTVYGRPVHSIRSGHLVSFGISLHISLIIIVLNHAELKLTPN